MSSSRESGRRDDDSKITTLPKVLEAAGVRTRLHPSIGPGSVNSQNISKSCVPVGSHPDSLECLIGLMNGEGDRCFQGIDWKKRDLWDQLEASVSVGSIETPIRCKSCDARDC